VPSERPPDPLYFAFEQVEWRRNMQTMERYRVLPEDVGPAHDAIRVANSAGDFIVYTSTLNDPAHRVPHKSFNGATWHDEEDFTPPPDGFV
jgi:hypothetical protein